MTKTTNAAFTLLEDKASNSYQWASEWLIVKKASWVFEVDQLTALTTQISALSNQSATFTTHRALPKETIAMAYTSYPTVETSLEQVQYVNNRNFVNKENQLQIITVLVAQS